MILKIMGLLMPRPSEIISRFETLKNEKGIKTATQYFYNLCRKSDYIRVDRIARNIIWQYESEFGQLEVTINLTKPEKDPREIAALKQAPQVGYPKCVLCPENVGYAGRRSIILHDKPFEFFRLSCRGSSGIFNIHLMYIIMSIVLC